MFFIIGGINMDELEEFLKSLTIEELKVIYEEVSESDINK
ncbi:hypothetical protein PSKAS_08160 [Peribacillus sp. N1]|jgi:hypothetical protein